MERIKSRVSQIVENAKDFLFDPTFENLSSNFPHLDSCLQEKQLEVKTERVFVSGGGGAWGSSFEQTIQRLSCSDCGVSESFRGEAG